MNYSIKKIQGLECIFAPMKDSGSVTVQIMVKAGSYYEHKGNAGISHALEHLFFKGGKKWSTPKEVAIALDSIWGEFNASTGGENTLYYVKCAPQFIDRGIEVLADMLLDPNFSEEEIQREKEVIIQELKMYEDNPLSVAHEKWRSYFFGDTSHGRPIIGFEENIRNFTREDIIHYKDQLYTKDNLIIVVAGNIQDQSALEEKIWLLFWGLLEKKSLEKPTFAWTLPKQQSDFFVKKTEQNHLLISMPGIPGTDEQKYRASLLCTILGGNMSSRLFQEIREKEGLCYYIRASHLVSNDCGFFLVSWGLDKDKFPFGVQRISEIMDQLIEQGFSEKEFENAKNYMIGNLQMGVESSDDLADFLGGQYLNYGKIRNIEELLSIYQSIRPEELQALFPYLAPAKRYQFHLE